MGSFPSADGSAYVGSLQWVKVRICLCQQRTTRKATDEAEGSKSNILGFMTRATSEICYKDMEC
eukprot:1744606-Amphidinium_carterae.1